MMNKLLPVVAVVIATAIAGCATAPENGGAVTSTTVPAPTARVTAAGMLAAAARVVPVQRAVPQLPDDEPECQEGEDRDERGDDALCTDLPA